MSLSAIDGEFGVEGRTKYAACMMPRIYSDSSAGKPISFSIPIRTPTKLL